MSETTEVIETVVDPNAGKKGYKQCPKCKKYLAARLGVCECGHIFVSAKKEKPAPTIGEMLMTLSKTRDFVTVAGSVEAAKTLVAEVCGLVEAAGGQESLYTILDSLAALSKAA